MLFIRDNLTSAESSRRQGDTATVYGAYSALAQHYHSVNDAKTGVYFYEKCLEIARLTNDYRGEMASNHDLGLIYQSMKEYETAARYHERHLTLGGKGGSDVETRMAAGELVKVYLAIAEAKEKAEANDAAVQVCTEALSLMVSLSPLYVGCTEHSSRPPRFPLPIPSSSS
jgi:tetratricopeptide (TPR) repeat protein